MFHPIAPRFYHGKGAHTGWSKLHFDAWQRGEKKNKQKKLLSNFIQFPKLVERKVCPEHTRQDGIRTSAVNLHGSSSLYLTALYMAVKFRENSSPRVKYSRIIFLFKTEYVNLKDTSFPKIKALRVNQGRLQVQQAKTSETQLKVAEWRCIVNTVL